MLNRLLEKISPEQETGYAGKGLFLANFIRILLPSMLLVIIMMLIIYGAMVPLIENIYTEQKKEQCRSLVDIAISGLSRYNRRVENGEIDIKKAKDSAADIIREFRFGEDNRDYFWVFDHDLKLVVHPVKREFEGTDSSKITLSQKEKLSDILNLLKEAADHDGGGFSDYNWYSGNDFTIPVMKISYSRGFKPWGWIIGTGVQLDHLDEGIGKWKEKSFVIAFTMSGIAVLFSLLLSLRAVNHYRRERDALAKLSSSEKQFRSIFNLSPASICITRMDDGTFVAANPAYCAITGYSESELTGRTPLELGIISTDEGHQAFMDTLKSEGAVVNRELTIYNRNGEENHIIYSSEFLRLEQFTSPCILTMIFDITENYRLSSTNDQLKSMIQKRTSDLIKMDMELKAKSEKIEYIEKQLILASNVFSNVSESVAITDREGNIISINQAFTLINGFTEEEAIGQNPRILKSDRHLGPFYDEMWKTILSEHSWKGEIWNRRKNGEAYPALLSITAVADSENNITHFIAVTRDMTEIHRSRDELNYRVLHDVLTGLPNRDLFTDRLGNACPKAEKAGGNISVMMIGLDRFAGINNALGYPAGDSFLQEIGRRLKEFFAGIGSVARFGGDEFVGMVSFDDGAIHTLRVADDLLELLRKPYTVGHETLYLSASIGVATFPMDGRDPDELMRNAAIAMERAKSEGKNRYSLFTERTDEALLRRLRLETEIRNGIDAGEFTVFYQPKIDVVTGKVKGMESLMRWFPAEGKPVSPAEFIPAAEEIDEISRLGEMALNMACMMNAELAKGGEKLKVAVNVSPKQFFDEGFIPAVQHALDSSGLDPVYLELEITESTVMHDIESAVAIMERLGEKGVTFTLDDFGTGYSSLSHIKNLPLSGVKFDSTFIRDVADNSETRAIIKALASMCSELMLELTVEGVETEEQLKVIKRIAPGAMIQGYYYSRPLDGEGFRKFLGEMV